jgi:hypothetical protein
MSRLVQPVPFKWIITYNEVNGVTTFTSDDNRVAPLLMIVAVFCQLVLQFIKDAQDSHMAVLTNAAKTAERNDGNKS